MLRLARNLLGSEGLGEESVSGVESYDYYLWAE